MKETLLSNVKIVSPGSKHHGNRADVMIGDGIIKQISNPGSLNTNGVKTKAEGMLLTPGWLDINASFHDPGNEHKEDLISGAAAAMNGGFTQVFINPDTFPVIDNKSIAEYILRKAAHLPVKIQPIAAVTQKLEGRELTEMYDLGLSGIGCFSNGRASLTNPGMLKLALLYAASTGSKIFSFPHNDELNPGGMINEGKISTSLGIKSLPPESEIMRVNRDLYIAQYCDCPIHFSCITTAGALKLIREAKEKGLPVTCDTAYFNLAFNDEELIEFDSNFKLNPPLRSEEDRLALVKGVNDGTVDAVCTNHHPQNIELKECEFHLAAYGAATIETLYPVYTEKLTYTLNFDALISALATGPVKVTGQKRVVIDEGASADLTLLNPHETYLLNDRFFKGKSRNNPWFNKKVTGKVVRTFTGKE